MKNKKLIKLLDIPRNSKINVEHLGLYTEYHEHIKELDFKHIDGMYSLSYYKDIPIHLKFDTMVYLKE